MTDERKNKIELVLKSRQNNLTVVLENVHDPRNIAAVMRTCDAVGIQDIFTINTTNVPVKKFSFKSARSANKWITIHQFLTASDCFEVLRKKYSTILATHLTHNSIDLYSINFTESIALVFGNEQQGISEEVRILCDGSFVIPQVGMIQSLNISVACAVSIYEAYRQKKIAGHYLQSSLDETELTTLSKQWGII